MTRGAERPQPVAVELFCGVGGMTLGFLQAGVRVVGGIDASERAVLAHAHNFPDIMSRQADISRLSGNRILGLCGIEKPRIDILFGGPPCQGFSVGGAMDPSDDRNNLILDFARIVCELHPSYFVLENVFGLLNPRYEQLLTRFEHIVRGAGFVLTKPFRVLDAADFGVPQRRRRVFLLGSREGCVPISYPERWPDDERPSVWESIGDLSRAYESCRVRGSDVFVGQLRLASTYSRVMRGEVRDPLDRWPARRRTSGRVSGFAFTEHSAQTVARFDRVLPGEQDPVSRFIRLRKDGICPTLRAGTGFDRGRFMAPRPIHPVHPRCICLREAARLHSFPDWFEFHDTKWHGFMQIGNSVPPRLARAVALEVVRAFEATHAVDHHTRDQAKVV